MATATIEKIKMTDIPPAEARSRELSPEVLGRFHEGDLDALAAVFDRYAGPVTAVVRRVIRNEAQAEDAVQETFMKAWRSAASYDPQRPLGSWLFTIAHRTAIDVVRREGRPTRSDHDELTEQVAVDLAVDGPGFEATWEAWEVRVALDQLPEDERMVMQLSHYNGLSHPQIAMHLGIPTGTVKSRSFRAHRRLVGLLEHIVAEVPGGER